MCGRWLLEHEHRNSGTVFPAKANSFPEKREAIGNSETVIPANAGIHLDFASAATRYSNRKMDPGVRRDDEQEHGGPSIPLQANARAVLSADERSRLKPLPQAFSEFT